MKKLLRKLAEAPHRIDRIERRITDQMLLNAKSEVRHVKSRGVLQNIRDAEFKVFSQWGEDGIIQYLIHQLGINSKSFIEFGVENYRESNTRFLLMNDLWRGLVLDGSEQHMATLQCDHLPWLYDLRFRTAFITAENINTLIQEAGFSGPLGILSIDIDGNDYWVWKAINTVQPDIVIVEYNAAFGPERPISIPYKPDFVMSEAHHSRQYFGASLMALCHLAQEKQYFLAGCTSAGNNAFFVHSKFAGRIPEITPGAAFVRPHWRTARDKSGELLHGSFEEGVESMRGLPVVNVTTGETQPF